MICSTNAQLFARHTLCIHRGLTVCSISLGSSIVQREEGTACEAFLLVQRYLTMSHSSQHVAFIKAVYAQCFYCLPGCLNLIGTIKSAMLTHWTAVVTCKALSIETLQNYTQCRCCIRSFSRKSTLPTGLANNSSAVTTRSGRDPHWSPVNLGISANKDAAFSYCPAGLTGLCGHQ